MAKQPSPTIDPKVLRVDVLNVVNHFKPAGVDPDKLAVAASFAPKYEMYDREYVYEWVESMLDKLTGQGAIILKNGRYYPAKPPVTA
jgi:hypothetical protein